MSRLDPVLSLVGYPGPGVIDRLTPSGEMPRGSEARPRAPVPARLDR